MVLLAAAFLALPAPALARAAKAKRSQPVPAGFAGMMIDGPMWPATAPGIDMATQLNQMVADGVESLRMTFDWAAAQPYASWAQLRQNAPAQASAFTNVGGVPTNFSALDQIVTLAAQRRLTILPVTIDAPGWDARHASGVVVGIPARDGPYARFMRALVERYGPRGTFWSAHPRLPKVPIRYWEVWNEPDIPAFWSVQPFAKSYVALLRAAHRAIKAADPGAKVVLAGLANFSWLALSKIYAVHGANKLFDVLAVHPYTKLPRGVITILTNDRRMMDRHGDAGKPILADEISWPSALGKTPHNVGYDFLSTATGQAHKLSVLLPMLAKDRRALGLLAFYYYTWASTPVLDGNAFDFSGLYSYSSGRLVAKPALAVYRRSVLALESCRRKGSIATRCLAPG